MLLKDREYIVDIVDIGQGGVGIGKSINGIAYQVKTIDHSSF